MSVPFRTFDNAYILRPRPPGPIGLGFSQLPPLPPGIELIYLYEYIFQGAAVRATRAEIVAFAAAHPEFIVEANEVLPLADFPITPVPVHKQQTGAFLERIGVKCSRNITRADINVFVIGTGIYPHVDLNVVGGVNFTSDNRDAWVDTIGASTHAAGIIGALDNRVGIVGVAPGVNLWAVKVVNAEGIAQLTNALAALDWILGNRGNKWFGRGILHVGLGIERNELIDFVVGSMVQNGVIPVVKAGDLALPAVLFSPAGSVGAIAVGSVGYLGSCDSKSAGSTGPNPTYNTFSSFSNTGRSVAILAPGETILSTIPKNKYGITSGTSSAAAVVAGTIALILSSVSFISVGPAFVADVRAYLILISSNRCNPRIKQTPCDTTDISVWAGKVD